VVVNRQLDKFLLSRWAGLNFVSSYEIALRLAGNVGTLQPYLAGALLPASSSLSASGENAKLREAYRKATKYLFLVGIPPFVFLLLHGNAAIRVWVGTPRSDAAAILIILAAGHMVNSLSNAMAFVCQGIGKPGIQTAQSLFQLLTNVVLSITLFRLLGPLGAPMGTTIAFISGAAFFALMFHRHIDISTWTLLREAAVIPLIVSVVAALPLKLYPIWNLTESRLVEITGFLIAGVFFCVIYGVFCLLTGYVGRNEWKELKNVLSSLKGGVRG
jgi:O-antigen/teichoic acid export membrane protein